jgi:hypothetical protein
VVAAQVRIGAADQRNIMTALLEDPAAHPDAAGQHRLIRIRARMAHPAGVPIAVDDVEFLASLIADLPQIVEDLRRTANTHARRADRSVTFNTATVLSILDDCVDITAGSSESISSRRPWPTG